ncbi:BQ2448_4181 [Microbotryum intermedium]|uniref:BQ2448_4181 protein n=1 Tax=Microbotryum intermedium TaxID=269621 RepID=A0A238FL92_9BASI|nr:BQ2448_4181 [Microbotryum intermedium]
MALSSRRKPVPTVHLDATDAATAWPSQERHRLGDASSPETLIIDGPAGTSANGAKSMSDVRNDQGIPRRPINQQQHQRSRSWLADWLKSGVASPSAIQAANENVPPPTSLELRSSITRPKSEVGRAIKTLSVLVFRRKNRGGSHSEHAVAPVVLVPTPSTASDVPPRRPLPPTLTPDQGRLSYRKSRFPFPDAIVITDTSRALYILILRSPDFVALRSPINVTPHHTLPAAALTANKRTTIAPSSATTSVFPTRQSTEKRRSASWDWDGGPDNVSLEPNGVRDAPSRDRIDSVSSVYSHDPVDLGEIWDDLVTKGEISLSDLIPTQSANVFPVTPTSALTNDDNDINSGRNSFDVSTRGMTSHNLSSDTSVISFASLSAFPSPPLDSGAVIEHEPILPGASSLAERRGRKQAIPALIIPRSLVDLAIDSCSDDDRYFGDDGFSTGGPTISYFSPITPPCGAPFGFDLSASTGSSRSSIQMSGLAISHVPYTEQNDQDDASSYEQERSTSNLSDVLARHLPVSKNAFLHPFQQPILPRSFAPSPTFGEKSDSELAPSSTFTATSTFSPNLWSGSESNTSFETRASSVEENGSEPPQSCSSRRGGESSSFDPDWSLASAEQDGSASSVVKGSSVDEQSMSDSFGRGKRWIEQEVKGVGIPGNASTRTDDTRATHEASHVIDDDDEDDLESEDRTMRLAEAFGKKEVERRRVEAYDWGEGGIVEPFMTSSQRTTCEEELGTNEIVAWGVAL